MALSAADITHLAPPLERLKWVLEIAREHAGDVDTRARFPKEAIAALKQERLLGIMVPEKFGGEDTTLGDIAVICAKLGEACASTAMVFAMHNIKVSSLVTHGLTSPWHVEFMQRLAKQQYLLGSATTEAGIGGDLRHSLCAVVEDNGAFNLTKDASVISYATECDAILVTARRNPDATKTDQVMAVVERTQYTLEKTLNWDTMGMRGTCSEGFMLRCQAPSAQIFPHAFADIAAQSMLAMAHLMWASVWYGIAADAVARAQKFVRAEARKKPGVTPLGAVRLSRATVALQELNSTIQAGIRYYESVKDDEDELSAIGFCLAMNNIKISASEKSARIVQECLMINGIAGYRNDNEFSVSRNLRDVLSAALMVHNDRIEANSSNLLLVSKINTAMGNYYE